MKEEIVLIYSGLRSFNLRITSEKIVCEVSSQASWDHFVGVNKMVDHGAMNLISQNSFVPGVDFRCLAADNSKHIRPLAVRPLTYSEGVPNPWGFFISGAASSSAGVACHG